MFCRWKSTDNNEINIFQSLETPLPFCLRTKRPENVFLTLIVNYRKIVQKKETMLFKTTVNSLLNDLMLFSHSLLWLKYWRFSTSSSKEFIVSLNHLSSQSCTKTSKLVRFELSNWNLTIVFGCLRNFNWKYVSLSTMKCFSFFVRTLLRNTKVLVVGLTHTRNWHRTSHGCSSVNLLHIFRAPIPRNTSEGLLLAYV